MTIYQPNSTITTLATEAHIDYIVVFYLQQA